MKDCPTCQCALPCHLCPFCNVGRWEKTPTQGRMICTKCGAVALVGRSTVITHTKDKEKQP